MIHTEYFTACFGGSTAL